MMLLKQFGLWSAFDLTCHAHSGQCAPFPKRSRCRSTSPGPPCITTMVAALPHAPIHSRAAHCAVWYAAGVSFHVHARRSDDLRPFCCLCLDMSRKPGAIAVSATRLPSGIENRNRTIAPLLDVGRIGGLDERCHHFVRSSGDAMHNDLCCYFIYVRQRIFKPSIIGESVSFRRHSISRITAQDLLQSSTS